LGTKKRSTFGDKDVTFKWERVRGAAKLERFEEAATQRAFFLGMIYKT